MAVEDRTYRCVLGLLVALLHGCGQSPLSETRQAPDSNPAHALFVVMGGYNSCGYDEELDDFSPYHMPMYRPFERLIQSVNDETDVVTSFLATCYVDSDDIYFYTSLDEDQLYIGDRRTIREEVIAHDESQPIDQIFWIGHSYGGWLTLKSVLSLTNHLRFHTVFTLDPISRVDCSFSTPWGCQSAPTDISSTQYQRIADGTDAFVNFYQRQTLFLRSSEIEQAHANYEMSLSHIEMDTNRGLWNRFRRRVFDSETSLIAQAVDGNR